VEVILEEAKEEEEERFGAKRSRSSIRSRAG